MSFDSLNRYSANHKPWDHVGNIIPDIEHCEGERPAHEFHPAAWLPVQFWDKHYEQWNVIMPGKAVALDPDGNLMPAQYGLTGASVVYTANDVVAGTIDIATGVAVTAAKTVVLAEIDGTRDATWTAANAGTTGVESGFLNRYGVDFIDGTIKYPIGVAPYAYLQWAGGDGSNPSEYARHNYNMQHQVAVLCDYVIKLPLIPLQVAAETVDKTVTASLLVISTANVHTRAFAQQETQGRYNATTGYIPVLAAYPVVAIALAEVNVATNTARTLITMQSSNTADDVSTILVNEVSSLSALTAAGDFWVDYPVGVVFIYSADGATLPTALSGAAGTVSITYYHTTTDAGVVSRFASVVSHTTPLVPGDFLGVDANSNLVKATTGAGGDTFGVIGQVLAIDSSFPKDALDRVRTAYDPALNTDASGSMANAVAGTAALNLGQMDQMPGSATAGYPDSIHYAGAADTMVIINLIGR